MTDFIGWKQTAQTDLFLVNQQSNQQTNQLTNQSTKKLTNQQTNQPINTYSLVENLYIQIYTG